MVAARNTREQLRRVEKPPTAPLLITDGIEVTADAIWVWVTVPDASTYLLEDDDLADATLAMARTLGSLIPPGAEFHLKSVRASHTGDAYRASWEQVASVRAPRAAVYIDLGAHRIDKCAATGVLRKTINLLGVRWPEEHDPTETTIWSRFSGGKQASSRALRAGSEARLTAVEPGIRRWFGSMARSAIGGTPAPAGLIGWAYARELRRTALSIPDASVLTAAGMASMAHGRVDPTLFSDSVVVTDLMSGSHRFVSILVPAAVTGFPAHDLSLPGGEWLRILADVDGVEASVRGVNHGQTGSRVLLERALKVARSQIRESEITEGPPPPAAVEAEEVLTTRLGEVQHRTDVMVTTHARWVVDAESPEALADRVAELRQRYDGIVDLQLVSDVQDLLWRELLPGDEVRVPEFGADQPMRTLAGSWFHGGSPFGDPAGPYMGVNLGSSPDPVQLHIASRTEANKKMPTTVVFTGRSGSGKSTSLELFVLGLLAEGAWVLLPDVKGDLAGIVAAARDVLGVPVQSVDAMAPQCAGMMDPMRFAPTADEARTLAMDVLMGALSADDRRVGEAVLEAAIDAVLRTPRAGWSTSAVVDYLTNLPLKDANAEVGRRLGKLLAIRAESPQLRAVAGDLPAGQQALQTGRGLVYLRLDGLDFPHHTPDPQQWSVPQRCSMATLRVSLAYALHQSRRVRELKKAVTFPELHLLANYPEGLQFIEWLCRVGRALQTYVLLDSQSALDLAKLVALVEQILMAFCFRATTPAEQDAQGTLLGRPSPGPQLREAMRTLGIGECIAMDRHRRLTVMQFDRLTTSIADQLSTDAGEDTPSSPIDKLTSLGHQNSLHNNDPRPDIGRKDGEFASAAAPLNGEVPA